MTELKQERDRLRDALRAIVYAIEHTGADRNVIHHLANAALGQSVGDGTHPDPAVRELRDEVDRLQAELDQAKFEGAMCVLNVVRETLAEFNQRSRADSPTVVESLP